MTNRVRIHPQPGWPGTLEAMITHRVGADGLTVTVEATNIGAEAALRLRGTPIPDCRRGDGR